MGVFRRFFEVCFFIVGLRKAENYKRKAVKNDCVAGTEINNSEMSHKDLNLSANNKLLVRHNLFLMRRVYELEEQLEKRVKKEVGSRLRSN